MTRRKAVPTLRTGTKPGPRVAGRKYTGAEFVEHLSLLNRTGVVDLPRARK